MNFDGVEYKLSQYADDTSIIFDRSPQSIDGILREYFAYLAFLHFAWILWSSICVKLSQFLFYMKSLDATFNN